MKRIDSLLAKEVYMLLQRSLGTIGILLLAVAGVGLCERDALAQWPQWGGPNRDFTVETSGLADSWPDAGPKKLWHRELGDGYSSIVCDSGVLYTMYRRGQTGAHEYTIALDAQTGETVWEHRNRSPLPRDPDHPGPHSTPLVVGDRVITVGTNAVVHCFRKTDGKVLWRHDLVREFGAPYPGFNGYAPSPIAYGGMVIIPMDRERDDEQTSSRARQPRANNRRDDAGQSLVAFDQETGRVVWKGHDFKIGHSSPILIGLDGEDQLVLLTTEAIIGVAPENGALLWQHRFEQQAEYLMTPVWLGDGRLLFSSTPARGGGASRMIRLARENGQVVAKEVWHSRKALFIQANPIVMGEYIYGSSGHNPPFIVGVNARTGERVWAERKSDPAAWLQADGKVLILDQGGQLSLGMVTPEGLTVHSRCKVTDRVSFTVPTLVGKTLYVRDRKHIMALDLG